MLEKMKRLVMAEDGQGMTEYAVVLGLVVVIALAVVLSFREPLQDLFNDIGAKLGDAVKTPVDPDPGT